MTRLHRLCAVVFVLLLEMTGLAQDPHFGPGVERWDIKTSLMPGTIGQAPHQITFTHLRDLHGPSAALLHDTSIRMRKAQATGPQEGDIVSTTGWVQLVAVEATKKKNTDIVTDGDYHIQVSAARDNRDGVVIVEVPRPEFVSDPALKQKVDALRAMLRTKLHGGTEFSRNSGSCIVHPVRMQLVGQLFYDASHTTSGDPGGGRGKQGHKAATLWEIHPLFDASILSKKGQPAVPCK